MVKDYVEYCSWPAEQREQRIREIKDFFGKRLLVLAHHYQKDEVVRYADCRGDSLKLAEIAARTTEAEFIVFCGVHFMAETADILSGPEQKVILPDLLAGCSMADMVDAASLEDCWEVMDEHYRTEIVPVAYVNSSAEVKAFCGRHGGLTCTSGNAARVFERLYAANKSILFVPDEHLGRNTGLRLGLTPEEIFLWDPKAPDVPLPRQRPKLILWKGFCCVHQRFFPDNVAAARQQYPGIKVIVHPECPRALVEGADDTGSTEYIIKLVNESPVGSAWAIGTEANLVNRLARENPDKTVVSLNPHPSYCKSMNRLTEPGLLWALDNLWHGQVVNEIHVDEVVAEQAAAALRRMLAV